MAPESVRKSSELVSRWEGYASLDHRIGRRIPLITRLRHRKYERSASKAWDWARGRARSGPEARKAWGLTCDAEKRPSPSAATPGFGRTPSRSRGDGILAGHYPRKVSP